MDWKDSQMEAAMGRISAGRLSGTPATQAQASSSVICVASARLMPRTRGPRAAAESRVPPQSGHGPSTRNFATRFRPFSSFALAREFSTVRTALK